MPFGMPQEAFMEYLEGFQYLEHPDNAIRTVCILAPLVVCCVLTWYYLNTSNGGENNMPNESNTYRKTTRKSRKKRRSGNHRIAQPQSDTLSLLSTENSGTWTSITDTQSTTLEEGNNVALPYIAMEKNEKMVKVQQESFNIKYERKQDYAKAVVENGHSWKTFETAIFYMHKCNVFKRSSASVIMAINHLDGLRARGRRTIKLDKYEIPEDYSRAEIENIFTRTNIDVRSSDIDCTFKEFSIRHGYPPSPEEFQDLYDKTICIDFMRKELDELRETNERLCTKNEELFKCVYNKKTKIQHLQSQLKEADECIRRSKCKCCLVQEISVVFRPCCHSVFCADCDSRMQQCSSNRNVCPICDLKIKSRLKIYLS